MSSNTWTPAALASNAGALRTRCWRVVEAQSKVSTLKLTDTLDEQSALEDLIERSKPAVPEECRHLGYLLLTPFRYIPYPFTSRFRRAGSPDGVFYAAEASETAVAEAAFYRLLFFAESPDTPWPANPGEYTAFAADIATAKAIDLMRPPLVSNRALWTRRTDYAACLDLADNARAANLEVIRYESVRDPQARANIAVLTCRAFAEPDVTGRQTWHLHFGNSGVRATCESPAMAIPFVRDAFAADPRVASMRWDR
ncbi:MAG: RES family NAD+ phosphorylase [Pseudolabrys sp.]